MTINTYSFGEWLRARRERFRLTRKEVAEHTAVMRKLREAMGEGERDRMMGEGGRLTLDEAVLLALEGDRTAVRRMTEKAANPPPGSAKK